MNYTIGDDKKREKRLRRFNEFHGLQQFNHYIERSRQLNENKITKEEFNYTCHVSKSSFERLKSNVPEWIKLWEVKEVELSKIRHWHGKVTIEAMFDMLDDESNAWEMYGFFCHGTHLSPSSHRMTSGLRLIGFPKLPNGEIDLRNIENLTGNMILALQRILMFLFSKTKSPLIWEIIAYSANHLPLDSDNHLSPDSDNQPSVDSGN